MRRTFRPLAILILLLAILYLEARALGRIPAYVQYCEKSQHTGYEECATYHISIYTLLQSGKFLDAISPAITALATFAIATFTWTIWQVNKSQLAHGQQVERAYMGGGGMRYKLAQQETDDDGNPFIKYLDTGLYEFHVHNHGKTRGRVYRIGWGFCEEDDIPRIRPVYETKYFNSWISPGTPGLALIRITIPQTLKQPAVYGRVWYETIFNEKFSSGFLYRIPISVLGSESIPPPDPDPGYINECKEN
jgi:hypothetical protein